MDILVKFAEILKKVPETTESIPVLEEELKKLSSNVTVPQGGPDNSSWRISEILRKIISDSVLKTPPDVPNLSAVQQESLDKCLDFYWRHGMVACFTDPWVSSLLGFRVVPSHGTNIASYPATPDQRTQFYRQNATFFLLIIQHNNQLQVKSIESYMYAIILILLFLSLHNDNKNPEFIREAFAKFEDLVILEKHIQMLLLIMGSKGAPPAAKDWLHRRLIDCIQRPSGLQSLCKCMLAGDDETIPLWSRCQTVAKLICGLSIAIESLRKSLLEQLDAMHSLAVAEKDERFIAVTTACFNELHENEKTKKDVAQILTQKWKLLAQPEDLLTGICIYDEKETRSMIESNHAAFCTFSVSSLKSQVIFKFIPLLFQFATLLEGSSVAAERKKLESIIVQAMANREATELREIVERILFPRQDKEDSGYFALHKRVGVKYQGTSGFSVVIIAEEEAEKKTSDHALQFVQLMKESNHNILIFNVFMQTLKIFDEVMTEDSDPVSFDSQLVTEEDAESFVGRKFMRKSVIVATLAELISHRPFHFQFAENPTEILQFIEKLLRRKVENFKIADEQILILIISLFREFIGGQARRYSEEVEVIRGLARKLREDNKETISGDLKIQIDFFLNEWRDKEETTGTASPFELARELCMNQEPYLRVYGMKEMMKLIRSRDTETLANLHAILLSALVYIKDEDSYSFLASIQLLVLLTRHLEGTVIETLIVEFQDGTQGMDYRLKIGEAIVKTVEGLGVLSVKYKDLFINCFLKGIEDKASCDEYRVSCIFNLGQICKLLSFQVHSFFNEMVATVKMVLEQEAYVPARRAAALLLVDLLKGMESLVDFQEFLLPVYRLLKHICETEEDEKTRVHAAAGLDCLKVKIKEELSPVDRVEKEIKVLGIETEKERKVIFPK